MAKFEPTKTIKPQEIPIGDSIEIHAKSLATFKTYVSRANAAKERKESKIRFHYAEFIGSFCKATRLEDEVKA